MIRLHNCKFRRADSLYRIDGTPFTSIGEIAKKTPLVIFPNPAKIVFSIKGLKASEEVLAFNLMGVSFPLIQNEAGQFVVDDLKAGIYFLKSNGGSVKNSLLISILLQKQYTF